jgi:hypothetical protein
VYTEACKHVLYSIAVLLWSVHYYTNDSIFHHLCYHFLSLCMLSGVGTPQILVSKTQPYIGGADVRQHRVQRPFMPTLYYTLYIRL